MKTDLFNGVFNDEGPDSVEFSREKKNEMLNRLRQMMGDEPEPEIAEPAEPEEIPEDLPYYLNPKVMADDDIGHEGKAITEPETRQNETETYIKSEEEKAPENILAGQPPEKIESALNSGMEFVSQLLEIATGQKMENPDSRGKMVSIDKNTGEVTMKFKLPGF
ncbi:MAG: hypothetical protein MI863_27470 [Desulfobacterales bacterium]|nr:hypothetical protein [Desulfobacterales bacterium]